MLKIDLEFDYGTHQAQERFSNWGPLTKGGPRRVPSGSAKAFRKVFARFLTIYDPYVFKFAHISQSLSLSALRGSVAVVWHDRLSADVSYGPITIAIRARFEYDSTTIRLQHATRCVRFEYDTTSYEELCAFEQ